MFEESHPPFPVFTQPPLSESITFESPADQPLSNKACTPDTMACLSNTFLIPDDDSKMISWSRPLTRRQQKIIAVIEDLRADKASSADIEFFRIRRNPRSRRKVKIQDVSGCWNTSLVLRTGLLSRGERN